MSIVCTSQIPKTPFFPPEMNEIKWTLGDKIDQISDALAFYLQTFPESVETKNHKQIVWI